MLWVSHIPGLGLYHLVSRLTVRFGAYLKFSMVAWVTSQGSSHHTSLGSTSCFSPSSLTCCRFTSLFMGLRMS